MSQRKRKNVPSAKEPKPESVKEVKPQSEPAQVAAQKEASTVDAKEIPQKLIEIPEIDQDTKKMLAKAGVNWDSVTQAFEKVNIWAETVDARFNLILEKMPTEKGIADELMKRSMEERQKQAGVAQPSTGNVGGAGGNILGLLSQFAPLLTGGGSSEIQDKIMAMSLESLGLGNAVMKAIINKIAPEIASQLITSATPAVAKT